MSFLLSLLAVIESYAIIDKTPAHPGSPSRPTSAFDAIAQDSSDPQDLADEEDATQSPVGKPT